MASNDDGTAAHIAEALEARCRIADFPTTRIAAAAARGAGRAVLMGAQASGKTHLARATAGQVRAKFLSVGIHDILDMYFGSKKVYKI